MTVANQDALLVSKGDGTTDEFPTGFDFNDNSWVVVSIYDITDRSLTLQTITTHYTLAGAGDPGGGTITMVAAPTANEWLVRERVVPATQATDWVANDNFDADLTEGAFDKLTYLIQDLQAKIDRASLEPIYSTDSPPANSALVVTENIFIAELTSVADGSGTYEWNQVEPVAGSASFQDLSGGLDSSGEGNANPLSACSTVAINTIVAMFALKDSAGATTYWFNIPGTCG